MVKQIHLVTNIIPNPITRSMVKISMEKSNSIFTWFEQIVAENMKLKLISFKSCMSILMCQLVHSVVELYLCQHSGP